MIKFQIPVRQALLLSAALLLLTSACQPPASRRAWTVEDLRLLDPADDIPASTDLLAVYTRFIGADLEIRLDLLDLPLTPDYDLSLRLTTLTEEISVRLPAAGQPSVLSANLNLRARLVRNPYLDCITVRFNRLYLPGPFTLQAFSYLDGSATPADETQPVRSDALPPSQRAPLLVAFWDTFPAATPAQALRGWDGAHTGPNGGRHGLKHILAAAEGYGIPVALLDVKTPASLAALNFMGVLPQIRRLSDRGLLLLPDTASSEPAARSLALSLSAADGFDLPASQFAYSAAGNLLSSYQAQFISLPESTHLVYQGRTRLLPLPEADALQASADGPALDIRRALVAVALSADLSDLVTLGGSLPHSTWGASDSATPSFAWLAGHPWIRVLDRYDLLSFPVESHTTLHQQSQGTSPWLEALAAAPDNSLSAAAWQAYLTLSAPSTDTDLQALRAVYLGQVGSLLAAAEWAEAPSAGSSCDTDPDRDGQNECILANATYFAVFESNGARLTNLVTLNESGPHQLVAPTTQFTVGLSDPSEWHPERGEAADPAAVMGAFSDTLHTYEAYTVSVPQAGTLVFTNASGSRIKTYQLVNSGLEISIQAQGPISTRVPLAVDPGRFYAAPGRYLASLRPRSWTWGLEDGMQVEVRSDVALTAQGFTASMPFLSLAENPDQQFPRAHYFPFPFSIVNLQADGSLRAWISVK